VIHSHRRVHLEPILEDVELMAARGELCELGVATVGDRRLVYYVRWTNPTRREYGDIVSSGSRERNLKFLSVQVSNQRKQRLAEQYQEQVTALKLFAIRQRTYAAQTLVC
jgi:hypothetical protein